jgi:hypothetical protein
MAYAESETGCLANSDGTTYRGLCNTLMNMLKGKM